MKSIMISIRPEWVAKILNGEKTIEVRKTAPKCDLPIEVYIYCTKEDDLLRLCRVDRDRFVRGKTFDLHDYYRLHSGYNGKGKVVAKFTLKTLEEIKFHFGYYDMGEWTESYIVEKAQLSAEQLDGYLQASKTNDESKPSPVCGYAWHISDLVIFDRPKELRDFRNFNQWNGNEIDPYTMTKAPQSWCYCEIGE